MHARAYIVDKARVHSAEIRHTFQSCSRSQPTQLCNMLGVVQPCNLSPGSYKMIGYRAGYDHVTCQNSIFRLGIFRTCTIYNHSLFCTVEPIHYTCTLYMYRRST